MSRVLRSRQLLLLFPGQGSQYVGMGKTLANEFEVARQTLAEANETLGFSLSDIMFGGQEVLSIG